MDNPRIHSISKAKKTFLVDDEFIEHEYDDAVNRDDCDNVDGDDRFAVIAFVIAQHFSFCLTFILLFIFVFLSLIKWLFTRFIASTAKCIFFFCNGFFPSLFRSFVGSPNTLKRLTQTHSQLLLADHTHSLVLPCEERPTERYINVCLFEMMKTPFSTRTQVVDAQTSCRQQEISENRRHLNTSFSAFRVFHFTLLTMDLVHFAATAEICR